MAYDKESYLVDAGPLGRIEGLTIKKGSKTILHYFGGLPYALPPIGSFRFRAPRRLPPHYSYGTLANPGRFAGGAGVCPQPPSRIPPDPSLFDENCLQLNVWIPASRSPDEQLPVLVYFHGGFLQWGSPNWSHVSMCALLGGSAMKAIVILPAYRLNALGFLTGKEFADEASLDESTVGNMGFWDQRMALEWIHENIYHFGGDPMNITVGGYSAGAFSAFQQLAHELYQKSPDQAIIKRVFMLSNSTGVEPKTLDEHQNQFEEFIAKLGIPKDLSGAEKLARLRELPFQQLVEAQRGMTISEFRGLRDKDFFPENLFKDINSGDFARRMKSRSMKLLIGECQDEHTVYRTWRTPENSNSGLCKRLHAEYPKLVATRLMEEYCGNDQTLPPGLQDWQELFGRIYADMQVHCLERGFVNALTKGGMESGKDIFRYRFEKRLDCVAATLPVEWGVTHSSDVPIWFWGSDFPGGMTQKEMSWLRTWNAGFAAFVHGKTVEWETSTATDVRRWRSDGETDIWQDEQWERGIHIWNVVNGS